MSRNSHAKIWVLSHHVSIVFLLNKPIAMLKLTDCVLSRMKNQSDAFSLDVVFKTQYSRDEKGRNSCIKLNKNISNEFYCIFNEFPNHVFY